MNTSPFFRPLVIVIAIMIASYFQSAARGNPVTLQKFLLIGGWFLSGAVVTSFVQIIRKKPFGWLGSFLGVAGIGLAVALIMLGLIKSGLIHR